MATRPNIVCAIDRSSSSTRALDTARWLAQELDAAVTVVHVFDEWDIAVPAGRELAEFSLTPDDVVAEYRRVAEAWLHSTAEGLADVPHQVEFIESTAVEGVLGAVRERDAKLLVTGTAARGTIERLLAGSIAAELALKSPCPVVPVPVDAVIGRPGPVLAAYDGSDHAMSAARYGAALAARMDRKLVLLHALNPREEPVWSDDALGRELFAAGRRALEGLPGDRGLDLDVEVVSEDGDPVEVITGAARSRDAALVVAGSRGRGSGTAALLGSVSADLVRSADRPVVVARTV